MKLTLTDKNKQQKAELLVKSNANNLVQGVLVSHEFDDALIRQITQLEELVNNFVIGELTDKVIQQLDAYDWQIEGKDWSIHDLQIFNLKDFSFKIKENNVFSTTDFIAELKFLATEEGGRKNAVTSGYRPHIEFNEYPEIITSGQQVYIDQDTVKPGEKGVFTKISIANKEQFNQKLCKNVCFWFYEGKQRIGFGSIIEVVNPDLKVNWATIKSNDTIIYPKKEIAMYTLSNLEASRLAWTDISYAFYKFRSICKYHITIQSEEVDLRKMRFNDVEAYFKSKLREVCVAHIVIIEKADKGYETIFKGFRTDIYVDDLKSATKKLDQLKRENTKLFDFEYQVSKDDNWTDLGIMLY